MLDIIKDVLCASGYSDTDEITFNYEEQKYLLSVLRHNELKSQGFIVLEFEEEMLLKMNVKDDLFPEIFTEFKQSDLYDSEMDKNISLVFCVKRTLFSEKLRRKMVEIEDDPYFFKKYVFSYSEKEELDFRNLVKEKNCSSITAIESYIFNKEHFSKFKGNKENNNMYRLISDLVIKIPVIPIKFDIGDAQIHSVDYYLGEIEKNNNYDVEKLDNIVDYLNSTGEADFQEQINQVIDMWK